MGLSYENWFHSDFQPFAGEFPTVGAALNAAISIGFACRKARDVSGRIGCRSLQISPCVEGPHEMEIDCREDNKEREEKATTLEQELSQWVGGRYGNFEAAALRKVFTGGWF